MSPNATTQGSEVTTITSANSTTEPDDGTLHTETTAQQTSLSNPATAAPAPLASETTLSNASLSTNVSVGQTTEESTQNTSLLVTFATSSVTVAPTSTPTEGSDAIDGEANGVTDTTVEMTPRDSDSTSTSEATSTNFTSHFTQANDAKFPIVVPTEHDTRGVRTICVSLFVIVFFESMMRNVWCQCVSGASRFILDFSGGVIRNF